MRLLLIVGSRGSGKTSLCENLSRMASSRHLFCCGCLEVSQRGVEGRPYRVELVDIASGDSFLAAQRPRDSLEPFEFIHESFARIRERCVAAVDTNAAPYFCTEASPRNRICIIDEIGPLELNEHRGHAELLEYILRKKNLDTLVLTVRPNLVENLEKLILNHDFTTENYYKFSVDTIKDSQTHNAITSILDSISL